MQCNVYAIARAEELFRFFLSFSSSESIELTYFQVVATEAVYLAFNGCENGLTYNVHFYIIPLAVINLFTTFAKDKVNLNDITIRTKLQTKEYQVATRRRLPSFLFPQNAMCGGAPRVSHRHRPADDGSRFLRHSEEIRIACVRQGVI